MASSSVSQEDFDNDFELTSRRSRIRTARARVVPPRTGDSSSINFQSNNMFLLFYSFIIHDIYNQLWSLVENAQNTEESQGVCDTSSNSVLPPEHDNQQNKPIMRKQDKRVPGR